MKLRWIREVALPRRSWSVRDVWLEQPTYVPGKTKRSIPSSGRSCRVWRSWARGPLKPLIWIISSLNANMAPMPGGMPGW